MRALFAKHTDEIPPVDLPRNQWAVGADSTLFGIGAYFISVSTVLTALAANLTEDKIVIGLIPLGWQAAFLLPQLVAARVIHGKTRTKPYSVLPLLLLRPPMLLFPFWLMYAGASQPLLTVWLLVLAVVCFMVADSFATAGWFDMLGRIFTPRTKGKVITASGMVSAIGGIGVGLIVSAILAAPNLPFPMNYAWIMVLANVFFTASFFVFLQIKEVPAVPHPEAEVERPRHYVAHILALLRADPVLRRTLITRVCVAVESMAAAFYVVFAREQLQLPPAAVGVFTTAVVLGGIGGTAAFGWIFNRFGARRVINLAGTLQFLSPVLALLVSLFALPGSASAWIGYAVLFVVMMFNGAINRSGMLGFMTYAQNIAKPGEKPSYVGALNTMGGFGALMPVVGGAIIDWLMGAGLGATAYTVIFAIAATVVGFGVWNGLRLPHR